MPIPEGEQVVVMEQDQHLLKVCVVCGGTVHILVQDGEFKTALPGTCICRVSQVMFKVKT